MRTTTQKVAQALVAGVKAMYVEDHQRKEIGQLCDMIDDLAMAMDAETMQVLDDEIVPSDDPNCEILRDLALHLGDLTPEA